MLTPPPKKNPSSYKSKTLISNSFIQIKNERGEASYKKLGMVNGNISIHFISPNQSFTSV